MIVSHLYGEILDGFQFQADDEMAEEVVRKLRYLGGVLRFAGDGIGADERIVLAVIVHVPAVEGVEGDVVADGDVFQPL